MNYYNEWDKKTAAWLRELIAQGLIPKGDVDERSIADVRGHELAGYTQCHFFAGIGGWPYALQLAGWPTTRPVWTGSCPCQPFSAAGRGLGTADERHLWPEFARLIGECRPATVFGEQVASKAGREWLSGVFADLEGMGYAAAGADLCAASVGAPHIRQRLFWVGDADSTGPRSRQSASASTRHWSTAEPTGGDAFRLGDAIGAGPQGHRQPGSVEVQEGRQGANGHAAASRFWSDYRVIQFRDGKARRIESSIEPLAHGVPARVVRLRGFGNAIVPQVAAAFIGAYMGIGDTQ